jgi:hypothetical protein
VALAAGGIWTFSEPGRVPAVAVGCEGQRPDCYPDLILPAIKLYKSSAPRGARYLYEFTAGSMTIGEKIELCR